jgi:hypothetical protein
MQEASNYPANKTGQALRGREGFGCPLAQQLSDRFCSLVIVKTPSIVSGDPGLCYEEYDLHLLLPGAEGFLSRKKNPLWLQRA